MSTPYDIVILGSGTTAFAGALKGAEMGARVLMVEQSRLGGTCVNWGCIPSKTLIAKAESRFEARRGEPYGVNLNAAPLDCRRLMQAKQEAVDVVRRESYQKVLEANPLIDVLRGHGRFLSSRELQVGAEILVSDRFLIACGGVPRTLRLPGLADVDYLTSYSALHLSCFPRSMIIIGGGVIALEMGQMFSRFGTEVTILERGERVLKDFDPRLTTIFEQLLRDEGVALHFGVEAQRVYREDGDVCLIAASGDEEILFRAERIMLAVGTAPATRDIGLEEAGVATDEAGFIATDEEMRTTAPNIWAAGDCTGPPLIAPAGAQEGEVAVENMLDPQASRRIDHRNTPMAVFTDPEFAGVGLSADRARAEGKDVTEGWIDLQKVAKAHVLGDRSGGIVLRCERGSGRVLGVEMLAPRAADIIHEATLAVRFGLSVHDLASTVHVYPSISDGLRLAALESIRRGDGEVTPWHPGH
jgi:mercuric reductase